MAPGGGIAKACRASTSALAWRLTDTPIVSGAGREAHTSMDGRSLALAAVFAPDENGWTIAHLAEWPAVVACASTLDEARTLLEDAALGDSYQGRE